MISLARIKLALGVTTSDDDALLLELLDGAVAIVGTFTNRYWGEPTATTEYHRGNGIRSLYLLSLPYLGDTEEDIDITEQKAPGLTVTALSATAADGYELRLSPRSAWLVRSGGYLWRWGFEYVVDYMHGWDVDTLPKDIEEVIIALIRRRYSMPGTGDLKSETFDNYTYTRFDESDLNDVEKSILLAWKEPVMA